MTNGWMRMQLPSCWKLWRCGSNPGPPPQLFVFFQRARLGKSARLRKPLVVCCDTLSVV
jgi:hypothetical protein